MQPVLTWDPVYKSKLRMWLTFAAWLMGAILCGVIDHVRQSSVFLSVYLPLAAVIVVITTGKHRSRDYKFELMEPGAVRSRLGFEVRASNSRLEYSEGNRVVSWQTASPNASIGRFNLSGQGIGGWDPPFAAEPMDGKKKQEVAKAMRSALIYLQLMEEGKIGPK
jgi:hypothetical protein